MISMNETAMVASCLIAATIGGIQNVSDCGGVLGPTFDNMDAQSKLATAHMPVQFVLNKGPQLLSSARALVVTLRPANVDSDTPFLVQIFANRCGSQEQGPGQLLGVLSFFFLSVVHTQDFVLPAPQEGFPAVAPQDFLRNCSPHAL